MDNNKIIETFKKLKEDSKKRSFTQSVDLIITFKDIDMKKTENQVTLFANLPNSSGKDIKVCALVGPESKEESKPADNVVLLDDFEKFQKDKKALKGLANDYDFFVAQANIMAKVAAAFGRVFGPKGKMPNPKAGCVVPSKTNLAPIVERLRNTIKLQSRNTPMVQAIIGKEDMDEKTLAENAVAVYNQVVHALPQEKNNIKHVMLKLSMSKPKKVE